MPRNVYFPDDLLAECKSTEPKLVVGHKDDLGNYVVIAMDLKTSSVLSSSPSSSVGAEEKELMDIDGIKLFNIGTLNFKSNDTNLLFFEFREDGLPVIKELPFVNIIIFKSPNSVHMEFYSLNSILIRQLSKDPFSDKLEYHLNNNLEVVPKDANFEKMLFVVNSIDYLRFKYLKLDDRHVTTSKISEFVSMVMRYLISVLAYADVWRSFLFNYEFAPNLSLVKLSYALYQVDLRSKLLCSLPQQFQKIEQKTISLKIKPSLPNYEASLEYIRFYNFTYLILVDLFLGSAVRNLLYQNVDKIKHFMNYIKYDILYTQLNVLISWLMDNPAGFKLNSELSNFIGQLYLWALKFWYLQVVDLLHFWDTEFLVMTVLLGSKVFGLTFMLALVCDTIAFLQIHVICFNLSMTRLYNWQLDTLKSLFRLFYGKKYNVLRNRIDSQDYDFDQLLLGIILFTVLIYLLPTVLAFYLSFFILNLAFYLTNFVLQMIILFLNQLPTFIMLISLKNPKRLSDGLSVQVLDYDLNQVIVRMSSKSLSLFKLLSYYWRLLNLDVQLVSPKSVLQSFFSGYLLPQVKYDQAYRNFQSSF